MTAFERRHHHVSNLRIASDILDPEKMGDVDLGDDLTFDKIASSSLISRCLPNCPMYNKKSGNCESIAVELQLVVTVKPKLSPVGKEFEGRDSDSRPWHYISSRGGIRTLSLRLMKSLLHR